MQAQLEEAQAGARRAEQQLRDLKAEVRRATVSLATRSALTPLRFACGVKREAEVRRHTTRLPHAL